METSNATTIFLLLLRVGKHIGMLAITLNIIQEFGRPLLWNL